jgi:hypothetical protein
MFRKSAAQVDEAGAIRLLNQPQPLAVEADERDLPRWVGVGISRQRVTRIVDVWRIDDEWWRTPLSRRYFLVALDDGVVRTLFHDLIGGGWYAQSY